ncbi:MAG: sodium/proline symporter [Alphaproteobacteria bacterium]|nr:sodium/proline symporter [Alphaproteobacteria bacterium]
MDHDLLTRLAVVAVYFAALFAIGYYAAKRIHGSDDFFIGGKKLGFWVTSFSSVGESAWLFLGLSGLGALYGATAYWVMVGEVAGVAYLWFKMGKPLKHLSNAYGSITIPDYLESRFQDTSRVIRVMASGFVTVFLLIYIGAQVDATGSAFESFLKGNYYWGALLGFAIVLFYCVKGGYIAACWTELYQGVMMFITLLALPIGLYFAIDNPGAIVPTLQAMDPTFLEPWGIGGFSMLNLMVILGFVTIGLGHAGSPQLVVRFISIRDDAEIDKGRWVAVVFALVTELAVITAGIMGRALFAPQADASALGRGAQNVLPMLVETYFPPLVVGLYIAAVLAAIMATISALLVVASSAVARDFYQRILHPEKKESELTGLSRRFTLAFGALAFGLAMLVAVTTPGRTIFWFVIFGWSGITATFCPMMILSLAWKGYTRGGAIASMAVGFLSIPIFEFLLPKLAEYGPYFTNLGSLAPGFALSMLAGIAVSLIRPNPELAKTIPQIAPRGS